MIEYKVCDTLLIIVNVFCYLRFISIFVLVEERPDESLVNSNACDILYRRNHKLYTISAAAGLIIWYQIETQLIYSSRISPGMLSTIALNIIIGAIATIIIGRLEWQDALAISFVYQGILIVIERCSHKTAEMVLGDAANVVFDSRIFYKALLMIIFLSVLLLISIIKRAIYRGTNNISFKSALFPLFSIISIASIFYICYSNEYQYQIALGISFGFVVMNFFFLSLLHELTRKNDIIKEKEMIAVQSKDQLMMYSNISENYEKQRRLSHEHKNHLLCLQALIKNGKYTEAVRYIEDISDTYSQDEGTNIIDTNHIMVNSVINVKYREALSRQILLLFRVNDLSGIIISDADIVVLISNLLDNAIEATEKVKDKKIIRVKLMNEPDALIISVENPFDNILIRDDDKFETTKPNEVDMHGLGVKNIIGVINKYNGRYTIEEKGNQFKFSIMI